MDETPAKRPSSAIASIQHRRTRRRLDPIPVRIQSPPKASGLHFDPRTRRQFQKFYDCYGGHAPYETKRLFLQDQNLDHVSIKRFSKWLHNRDQNLQGRPKITAVSTKQESRIIPKETCNMPPSKGVFPGCGPGCIGDKNNLDRNLLCQNCDLLFHYSCCSTFKGLNQGILENCYFCI